MELFIIIGALAVTAGFVLCLFFIFLILGALLEDDIRDYLDKKRNLRMEK